MTAEPIKTIFLDIGGVLLSNGWDRNARRRAAAQFQFNYDDMDERHHLTFDTYEEGKLSLDMYLDRVVFHTARSFSREDYKDFMFAQSRPYQEMLDLIRGLKSRYDLHVVAISNEGRELTVYRIQQFDLASFIDVFVSSCFVHFRKPDPDIYRMALDISQAVPAQSVYIDDRAMFVEVAQSLGINGIHHTTYQATREALAQLGLVVG